MAFKRVIIRRVGPLSWLLGSLRAKSYSAVSFPQMINLLALIIVLLAALYFLALALVSFFKPDKASGFLLGFASCCLLPLS